MGFKKSFEKHAMEETEVRRWRREREWELPTHTCTTHLSKNPPSPYKATRGRKFSYKKGGEREVTQGRGGNKNIREGAREKKGSTKLRECIKKKGGWGQKMELTVGMSKKGMGFKI